ncbi:hypothetical protein [Photobacterium kagoshimensis]|uniref:hypothetical protein n=1 Tax=Photobacterium kagoshimensis TaxID=2910242 RepID=UPI003D132A7E
MRECSLVTAPTSLLGFNHGSAVAVDALCTYLFLNFLSIAAPLSRMAAFNIVVGALVGKWLHFGGCRKQSFCGCCSRLWFGLPFYQYWRAFLVHLF